MFWCRVVVVHHWAPPSQGHCQTLKMPCYWGRRGNPQGPAASHPWPTSCPSHHGFEQYALSFQWSKCSGEFGRRNREAKCTKSSTYFYKSGPYYTFRNVFEDLSDAGIDVPEDLRFDRYRATFVYEAYMHKELGDPRKQNNTTGYKYCHVLMGCSIANKVTGMKVQHVSYHTDPFSILYPRCSQS